MTWKKSVGLLSAGIVTGAISLILVQRVGQPGDAIEVASEGKSSAVAGQRARVAVESVDESSALLAEPDRRTAPLSTQNQVLREQANGVPDLGLPTPTRPTPQYFEEVLRQSRVSAKERDTQSLLAAGYSMERIEYLQRRAEELQVQFRQSNTDRMKNVLPPIEPEKALAFRFDQDIGLRYEIGDAEYERYLTALKRPTSVVVSEVFKGSIADSVGIRVGDEIVMYGATRVFNSGELDGLSLVKEGQSKAGESAVVTVRRDGQVVPLVVPKGLLGVREPFPDLRGRRDLSHSGAN